MYHIFCIHSSVEGHLGSFHLLAIINKAAMNIVEHVFLLPVGTSGYMPRRGIAGSSSSIMSNFLRNCQTDLQSGCTSLQSYQQWEIIARRWKEPRCPSTEEQMQKMWYIYTMEYYTAIKHNEFMKFIDKWMNLEDIILSEVTQSQKNTHDMQSLLSEY